MSKNLAKPSCSHSPLSGASVADRFGHCQALGPAGCCPIGVIMCYITRTLSPHQWPVDGMRNKLHHGSTWFPGSCPHLPTTASAGQRLLRFGGVAQSQIRAESNCAWSWKPRAPGWRPDHPWEWDQILGENCRFIGDLPSKKCWWSIAMLEMGRGKIGIGMFQISSRYMLPVGVSSCNH